MGAIAMVIAPLCIQAATFTVVNTNNAGNGSLRKAIQDANASAGPDTIAFNIPGAGIRTITLNSDLPTITETVDINGMTQPGCSVNTDTLGTNAVLRVEINGNSTVVSGFDIDAPNCRIRGLILNRFLTNSIVLSPSSSGTVIVGNFIGTNAQGNGSLGSRNGILVQSSGNSIGGSNLSQRNLFAGCTNNAAVRLSGASATNSSVRGNLFGLQRDGVTQIGTLWNGIRIELGSSDNLIGQPGIGANRIASCSSNGLVITEATSTGNIISGNVIYDNGGLAIDLNEDGVTVNDNGDADGGPNLNQNYPLLSLAATSGGGVYISGSLNSTSNSTYTVEFFSTPTGDPSGHGEAAVYLGNTTVFTNGSGNASFNVLLGNLPVNIGDVVSATARRNISGNTSELSAFVTVYADNDADGIADELDLDDDNDGIPDDIEDLGFDSRGAVIPCTQPSLDFQNPVLESGTALSLGAVYRFSNVTTGVDALVTISSVVNAVIQDIDDAGIGYPEAFQPRMEFSGTGTPGAVFMFEFVDAGTPFPTTLINRVGGTVDDIDGIANSESYVFYAISDYAVAQPSSLVAQRLPGSVEIRGNGTSDQPGISTDDAYRAFFQYKNINSFSLRCQQLRSTAGTEVRDLCVRFNECLLSELDNSQLTILEGTDTDSDGIPDHKDVDSDNDGLFDCTESGPVGSHTNGVLDGSVSAAGIPSAADIDQDNVINYVPSDHDGDGLLSSADLDSDNDGCYDVMEAGYTDQNGDGELGDDPVVVNGNGQVLSGIDGYGPIQDDDGDGIPDYQQITELTIVCPADISTVADLGACSANVTVPLPVVWFNCVAYSYSNDYNGTTNASDNYALGDTTVTYLVVDVNGDSAQCAFTVTVIDDQPPVITCPVDLSVSVDAGTCGAVVNYATPVGSDNCPGSATSLTAGLASGDVFPVGSTTVTYEVVDGAGLSASCSFTVTVVDDIPPTILCPSDITVNVFPGTCAADVNYTTPTLLDNCPGGAVALVAGPTSGSSFPLGTTVVTHEAIDAAGLTAQCSFSVTVIDNEAPAISCPANISVNSDAGICGAVVNYITPVGSDNCGASSTTLVSGLSSGSVFPIGNTTVTYNVTDGAGLSSQCSFDVTVLDATAPTIVDLPSDLTVNANASCAGIAAWTAPTVNDNCPGASILQTAGPVSGSAFPLGTTTITYTASDASGNVSDASFTVTVVDVQPPTISCPADIIVNVTPGTCEALVNYVAPVGTDNCSGATTVRVAGPDSGSIFPIGVTTITFEVTDAEGLTAQCSFSVTVVDNEAPSISCPANIVQNASAGTCGSVVTYSAPSGSDNCPGSSTILTAGLTSGSSFPVGTTTVTHTVTDASGNSTQCSFDVTIIDTEAPVISCPGNITVNNDAGMCGAIVNYAAPVGTDNCAGAITTLTAGQAAGSTFAIGTTTVTYEVIDGAGLSASCSFTVTVIDAEAPMITCPADITVNNDPGVCGAVVNYTVPMGTDNCPGSSTVLTTGPSSGSLFPIGTTTVGYTVTDAQGLDAFCSFSVTVIDATPPAITGCPTDIIVNADASCTAIANWTEPNTSDDCPGATITRTAGPASGSTFALGSNVITYTATDASGLTSTCSFTVTVVDVSAPVISGCPSNIVVNAGGSCTAIANWIEPTVSDNCSATLVQTSGMVSGSAFSQGTNTITYTATDGSGNQSTCSFTVTVNEITPPSITCPTDVIVNNDSGLCGAIVNYITPIGTDNCPGAVTTLVAGLASGSVFPVGITTVSHLVTDASGLTASCSFTVTVVDDEDPVISCPANISVGVDAGQCDAVVNFVAPVGTDNCAGAFTTQTAGIASGGTFPLGTTTNTFLVTDAAGNTASCSFTVTVVDDEDPVISCPANLSVGVDAGQCTAVVNFVAPVGTDNCAGAVTTQTAGIASGGTFPIGTTTNTFLVTDATGNTASCSFTVTVVDDEDPVISCPANLSVGVDAGQCDAVVSFIAPVGVDNCPGALTTQTAGIASGGTFPLGTTTNTFLVTDAAGNTASCSFTVTVVDDEDPVISCPANISVGVDAGQCDAVVNFVAPVGTDNCAGAVTTQTAGIAPGGTFPLGTTTNTFLVTDAAGNTASCSFTVTVVDDEDPVISCPANLSVGVDAGQCDAVVNFVAPVGTDNCVGAVTTQTAGIAPGGTFPLGTTTNTFLVTDAAGNTASCSFTVTVVDDEDPVISCPANLSVGVDAGQCTAMVSFIAPVGTDNCAGANTTQTAGIASGGTFPIGTTTNTFLVTDAAGNTASCSFTVTVVDDEDPVISCPANISVGVDAGQCTAVVSFIAPVGVDNCAGAVTTQTAGIASGGTFPLGTTTNTFLVTDAAGNTASCSFTVTVVDDEDPVISCPANLSVGVDAGQCDAVVNFVAPVGTDNCPGAVTTQTAGIASGGTFPLGTTTNTFLVTDAAGNTASCSFTVTVVDDEDPVISCPANISVGVDAGQCTAVVNFIAPVGTDNCVGAVTTQTAGIASGGTFPLGTTTNTFLVTDAAGNTASCSFTVTVVDDEDPVISCPANISVGVDAGQCTAVVSFIAPVGTDNCAGAVTTQAAGIASGGTFPLGTTTNTFLVTDAAGNTASCSFTVTVLDDEDPVISCPANIVTINDAGLCGAVVNYATPIGLDNCPGATVVLTAGSPSGAVFPVGMTTVSYEVTDAAGNLSTCSFQVTVIDNEDPVITCPGDINTTTNAGCAATGVALGTPVIADNCTGPTVSNNAPASFPLGTTQVIWTVTDASGNQTTCVQLVNVTDNVAPNAICQDVNLYLDGSGNANLTAADIDGGSFDNCGIDQLTAGQTTFTCAHLGANNVTLTATDDAGNTDVCVSIVTVLDTIAPVVTCQNLTLVLNSTGLATLTAGQLNGGTTDNCGSGTLTYSASQTNFTSVGVYPVILTVTDASGNSSSCIATVVVKDFTPPTVICQDITVYLNNAGTVSFLPADVDGGSFDNDTITDLFASPTSFNCGSTGINSVFLIATDNAGNSGFCIAMVTVLDTISPIAVCQDLTVSLNNNGTVSITPLMVGALSTDNCGSGGLTYALDQDTFTAVGTYPVTLTVTDASGNTSSCVATITVNDPNPPVAICQDTTIYLDANGQVSISANDLDGGSYDNGFIASISASQTTFNCGDLGTNNVLLIVTDDAANTANCTAVVTVLDTVAPTPNCQDLTVSLNNNGTVSITPLMVGALSTDNCGSGGLTYALDQDTFTAVGTYPVTLTVTDASGNTSSCVATITVNDPNPPVAICQDTTIYLDANGQVSISANDLDGGSYDNGFIASISASQTTFNCGDLGTNNVLLIVTDDAANTANCTAVVTVLDTVAPTPNCQDLTIGLNSNGIATITALMVGGLSTDNCGTGALTYTIDQDTFTAVGTYPVTLTVTDASGNTSSCVATITVNDPNPPVAICQDTTIYLDANGQVSISANDLDGGSYDNGTITSINASQTAFDCSHVGANNILVIVTDDAANTAVCTSIVTVLDTIAPIAICQNLFGALDNSGQFIITALQLNAGSTDNCGTGALTYSASTTVFTDPGIFSVTLTVTDASGNSSSCQSTVTIVDGINPVAICQDTTVYLDANGMVSITPAYVDGGSSDNDTIASMTVSQTDFICANTGQNTVILTVTDASGNSAVCVATVTVLDTIAPAVVCKNITVALDVNGIATISAIQLDNGTTDNCGTGPLTLVASMTSFTATGTYTVTLTATDASGNSSTCISTVTVIDVNPPTAICQDTTIYLDANGNASITAADIDGGSFDNGTIVSIVAGQTVFDCADLGSNQVTLTVTDNQGNIATCIALVTVLDTIAPFVICQNIEIEMDFFGNVSITGIDLDGGTTDNCGTGSLTYIADITDFHEEGVFEVVLTVIDGSGNSSSCTAEVTVTQPKKPLVIPSGFSPNGDGIADMWMIQGLEEFPNNSVVIINRWGNELYRAAPYQNDWYGQVNRGGSMPGDLPAGTYFYTIDLGEGDIRTGYLQLNR